jgi:hypothetical protein
MIRMVGVSREAGSSDVQLALPDAHVPRYAAFGLTGRPAARHAVQPPTIARAFGQPASINSRATRALVCSCVQVQ